MIKYLKYSGIAYLFLAAFSIYTAITRWDTERDNAYIFLGFSAVLIFLFFFKRKFVKRYEERARREQNKE